MVQYTAHELEQQGCGSGCSPEDDAGRAHLLKNEKAARHQKN